MAHYLISFAKRKNWQDNLFLRGPKLFWLVPLFVLFFVAHGRVCAQHVLNGKVIDQGGNPISYVSVKIKDTGIGTASDIDGKFLIEIPSSLSIIQISHQGYKNLDVSAGENRNREFILEIDEEQSRLDEVVVVGFGTQKKVTLTGAVSTVSMQEVEKTSTPSLSNALAGRLPGLITRQSSGDPGFDQAGIFIRGFNTLGTNNAPLILVDGVERSLDNLNIQEIESFSLLKDASATAVYGVRGANGVILITTKKGVIGRPKITFRGEGATLEALRLPEYIGSEEYVILWNEALKNVNQAEQWDPDEIEKFRTHSDPYFYPNVNWIDEVYNRRSYQTINNLNVSGGNEVVRYYTNVGYTEQSGLWKEDPNNKFNTNTNVKRYNFRSNVDVNLTKNLSVELGIGGIIRHLNRPGESTEAIFTAIRRTPPVAFPKLNPDGSPGGILAVLGSNPWGMVTQSGYSRFDDNQVQGTFASKWDLSEQVTPGLALHGRFAYDHNYSARQSRFYDFEVKQYIGKDDDTGEDEYLIHREKGTVNYSVGNTANRAIYSELILNYNRSFGKHDVSGMIMGNRREFIDISGGLIANLPSRSQGIASRATYSFDNRYLVEGNFGYNGSEQFPKGSQYGFFPSVSVGWIISNEQGWGFDFVNHLKLRASHGQSGNDRISNQRFLFLTTVNTTSAPLYPFGMDQQTFRGIRESSIGNMGVTWEVSTKSNIGLDIEMAQSKIKLQVDAFKERRTGILLQRGTMPAVGGFRGGVLPYANLGVFDNKGIDALIEANNSYSSGLFYSVRGNLTYARNKIIKNDEATQVWAYQSAIGRPLGQSLALVALGLFETEEEIQNSPKQTFSSVVRPGDIKYDDVNNDGVINDFDRMPMGYAQLPEIMYGFGGTIGYKKFDLSLFFTGTARATTWLEGYTVYPFSNGVGTNNVFRDYYENRWTPENPDPNAKYPMIIDGTNTNNYRRSSLWMRDASYLRLRNAEIAYTLSGRKLDLLGMNKVRIFINGMNLALWDKVKLYDPEAGNGEGSFPLQRSINFGVQVNFK